jgi:polyhydroxybutyrate depolymerase
VANGQLDPGGRSCENAAVRTLLPLIWRGLGAWLCLANPSAWAQQLDRWELTVEGAPREALVYAPAVAKSTATPVVFAFHGHGGSAAGAARMFAVHRHWPEAIAIYLQGLNTPGRLTDPEGKKPGWQHGAGVLGDRDLKFFDAVLTKLQTDYRVDAKRIYSTGHSNGGAFT